MNKKNTIGVTSTVCGFYKFAIIKRDGTKYVHPHVTTNIIVDSGLDIFDANNNFDIYCHVGSGTTAPVAADTALEAQVAYTSNTISTDYTQQSTAPYYTEKTTVYEFAAGTAAGNLTEVGTSNGTTFFSRALIEDGVGNPTTITILADEILQVTYVVRLYVPTADATGTVNLAGIDYTWTCRAARAATAWRLYSYISSSSAAGLTAYDGNMGATIADAPTGSYVGVAQPVGNTYVPGSFTQSRTLAIGIGDANFAGGIKSLLVGMGYGEYQFEFSPAIPKTSTDVLNLNVQFSWARTA